MLIIIEPLPAVRRILIRPRDMSIPGGLRSCLNTLQNKNLGYLSLFSSYLQKGRLYYHQIIKKRWFFLKTGKWRVGCFLLVLVLLVGAVTGTAFATTVQQADSPMATLCRDFVARLAANLGIDQAELTTAIDTTKQQMLDEAVQEGKITQEQADRIAARKGGGFCGFGFNDGRMGNKAKIKMGIEGRSGGRNLDGMASILGLTSEELKAELESGKNMQDILAEHGLTVEEFRQKMQEQREAQIARDVADGKITQEQADKILQNRGPRFNRFNCDLRYSQ
jgi:polyhydroxyalkanoate synthesis regulator phasin